MLSTKNKNKSYGNYSFRAQDESSLPLGHTGQDDNPVCNQSSDEVVMMTGNNNNNIGMKVECDPVSTTCFVDNDTVVRMDYTTASLPDSIEVRMESIKDFLAKPLLLDTLTWTTGGTAGTIIGGFTGLSIGNTLTDSSIWANKIQGFSLFRGTFHFRVKINANPFQQGLALIYFIPCVQDQVTSGSGPGYQKMHRANLTTKKQLPHVELNCRDSVAEMTIPYITPSSYFDIHSGKFDWGELYIEQFVPLSTGASGNNSVQVSIYGWFTDVELAAPVVPQMSKFISRMKTKVSDSEARYMDDRPISSGLNIAAKAADTLSAIPLLSPIVGPASWVARTLSGLASAFGYSKPDIHSSVNIMTKQLLRYGACATGHDTSYPLALYEDNSISAIDNKALTNQDEMSWNFLRKVPHYYNQFTWNVTDATGTSLVTAMQINPVNLLVGGAYTAGGHTANYITGAPWVVLATQFNLWRGSVNVTFKFIKTMFHSGTIQITWTPGVSLDTTPTTTSSVFSLREIVDIRYQSEITLNLPYMVYLPYLSTSTSVASQYYSGQLDVQVINELRAPENCNQALTMMVFFEAGDDYDLQVPGDIGLGTIPVSLQMDETIVNSGIAEGKRMNTNTQASSNCIGEHFTSVKQLLNRFSQIYISGSLPSNINQAVIVWPWQNAVGALNASTGAITSSLAGGDIYPLIANMYAFYRGSVRLCLNSSPTVNHNPIACSLWTWDLSSLNVVNDGATIRGNHTAQGWATTPTTYAGQLVMDNGITETESDDSHAYVRAPYYCHTPCSMVVFQSTSSTIPTEVSQPIVAVNFNSPASALVDYSLYRSFPDDFQLSYFLGMPPIMTSYT